MPSNKLSWKQILVAQLALLAATAHAQQVLPPVSPMAPVAPVAPVAPAVPVPPGATPGPHHAASAAQPARGASDATSAGTMSLREFEKLEREKALMALRKEVSALKADDQKQADHGPAKALPNGLPMGLPGQFPMVAGQPMAGAPYVPGMPMPGAPNVRGKRGKGAAQIIPPSAMVAGYKVLSIVVFKGVATADILEGDLTSTVKVGDSVGPGRVVAIDTRDGVQVEVTANGAVSRVALSRATDLQPRLHAPAPGLPNQFQQAIPPVPFVDATQVPMAVMPAAPRRN